jgi:membrane protein
MVSAKDLAVTSRQDRRPVARPAAPETSRGSGESPIASADPRAIITADVPVRQSALRRLVVRTLGICLRHRVTGLAAEAAFFAVLSLPPLIFGLAGSVGYVAGAFGSATISQLRDQVLELAGRALTPDVVNAVIRPTLDDVLSGGRADVISAGFILALWSGSRALNVFVDTISIMYGYGGRRGIVRTRALSFVLYIVALLIGILLIPLVLAGPGVVARLLPETVDILQVLYWPVVISGSVFFLATLYHVALPVRTAWRRALPGSVLCLLLWIGGAVLLRLTLSFAIGGTSIYGPLAAPIAVLVWLYVISISVLIGAALNAAWEQIWPRQAPVPAQRAEAD